jgi:hypothetical protein
VSCYTLLSGFRLPWPPSNCLEQLTPFVVSDERVFRHRKSAFGSSRIASSASFVPGYGAPSPPRVASSQSNWPCLHGASTFHKRIRIHPHLSARYDGYSIARLEIVYARRPSIQVVSLSAPEGGPLAPVLSADQLGFPLSLANRCLYHQKWPTRRSHSNAHRPIKRQGLPTHLKFENRARPFRPRVR